MNPLPRAIPATVAHGNRHRVRPSVSSNLFSGRPNNRIYSSPSMANHLLIYDFKTIVPKTPVLITIFVLTNFSGILIASSPLPLSAIGSPWLPPLYCQMQTNRVGRLEQLSYEWAKLVYPVLVPGGHIFIAATPIWSHIVFAQIAEAGFEKRGEIVRLVRTLRGGDRPKGAENEK